MTDNALSMQPSMPQLTQSLRAQPSPTLQAAIHSPADDAATMRRAHVVLALGFQPQEDEKTKLEIRRAFARALSDVPAWAMHRAFDRWEREFDHRPTPAAIRKIALEQMAPISAELRRRDGMTTDDRRERMTPDRAAEILQEAGFRPKSFNAEF